MLGFFFLTNDLVWSILMIDASIYTLIFSPHSHDSSQTLSQTASSDQTDETQLAQGFWMNEFEVE